MEKEDFTNLLPILERYTDTAIVLPAIVVLSILEFMDQLLSNGDVPQKYQKGMNLLYERLGRGCEEAGISVSDYKAVLNARAMDESLYDERN